MSKVIIVGGGISGLAFAYECLLRKFDVMVVEKESAIGGICKTITHNGCRLDLGVHVMYLKDKEVLDKVDEIVPQDKWIKIKRKGKLYLRGTYVDWPLRYSSLAQLPLGLGIGIAWDQLFKRDDIEGENYKSELLSLYGPTLYYSFFHPLTKKFLKTDPANIHPDWAFSSIRSATKIEDKSFLQSYQYVPEKMDADSKKTFNIISFLTNSVKANLKAEPFYYFKGGFGALAESYREKIQRLGGKILTNAAVDSFVMGKDKVKQCVINGIPHDADYVIWTVNPFDLCRMLDVECPPLDYLHTKFVYYFLKKCKQNHQVCYYADPKTSLVRGTILSNISKTIIDTERINDVICMEYTFASREEMSRGSGAIRGISEQDLKRTRMVNKEFCDDDFFEIDIPYTYPVLTLDYKEKVRLLKSRLSRFANILTFGRQANFNYDNVDLVLKEIINHPIFKMRGDSDVKGIDNKIGVLRNA